MSPLDLQISYGMRKADEKGRTTSHVKFEIIKRISRNNLN